MSEVLSDVGDLDHGELLLGLLGSNGVNLQLIPAFSAFPSCPLPRPIWPTSSFPLASLPPALSLIEDYEAAAVANALPNFHRAIPDFHSNSRLQAQLILTWETEFATQVLSAWKPSLAAWPELLGTAKDVDAAVKLMLVTLGPAEVRAAIAKTGDAQGGARQFTLMQALQTALKKSRPPKHPPKPANLPNASKLGIASGKELPLNDDTSVQIQTRDIVVDSRLASSSSISKTTITGAVTSSGTKTRTGPAAQHPSSSTQPTQHSSTKENIRPSSGQGLSRPKSTLPPRGGGVDLARLFAADDAKHRDVPVSYIPSTSNPIPSLRNPTPLNERSNLVNPSPLQPAQAEPLQDHTGSLSKSESEAGAKELGASTPKPKRYRRGCRPSQTSTSSTTNRSSPNEADEQASVPEQAGLRRAPSPALSLSGTEDDARPNKNSSGREAVITKEVSGFPAVENFSEIEYDSAVDETDEADEVDIGSDYEVDGVDSESGEVHGDKEMDGVAAQLDDETRPTEERYPDGFVDPLKPNPWTWDQEINDEKIELWEVEDLIMRDPRSTAPVRTKWMYEARKGGKPFHNMSLISEPGV